MKKNMLSDIKKALVEISVFLESKKWDEDRLNEYLDKRELETFEDNWLIVFERIEVLAKGKILNKEEIDEIRKTVFLEIFNTTKNSELAAYISDDFELIVKNILLELKIEYLDIMWQNYKKGLLPS